MEVWLCLWFCYPRIRSRMANETRLTQVYSRSCAILARPWIRYARASTAALWPRSALYGTSPRTLFAKRTMRSGVMVVL
jgi:hypothetical protein